MKNESQVRIEAIRSQPSDPAQHLPCIIDAQVLSVTQNTKALLPHVTSANTPSIGGRGATYLDVYTLCIHTYCLLEFEC